MFGSVHVFKWIVWPFVQLTLVWMDKMCHGTTRVVFAWFSVAVKESGLPLQIVGILKWWCGSSVRSSWRSPWSSLWFAEVTVWGRLVVDLLVGSMYEHRICCIVHIILCSLTVWFSVNVNWYVIKRNFASSYYCPRWPKVCYSVTPSDKINFLANQQHCTEAKVASTQPST